MLTWFMENMATIIISGVLVALVAAVIASMVRDKRKGKSSCGCGCAGCLAGSSCSAGSHCSAGGSCPPVSGDSVNGAGHSAKIR